MVTERVIDEIRGKKGLISDMDTDIIAGIESEIDTCLVLSGISTTETIEEFAYKPHYVLRGVEDIIRGI